MLTMSKHMSPLPSPRPTSYSQAMMQQAGLQNQFFEPRGMPSPGTVAPQFTAKAVINGRLKDISLSNYALTGEWLILIFIPMAWSFICPTEIRAFDRRIQEFETRTCAVAFCSTDSEYVLRAWNHSSEEEGGLGNVNVPLISDRSHCIARSYGVLIEDEGVAQRSMFIIDPRGVVRQITTNDANVGRSVDEARRLLDALEFTDEFGEGCPIDWKKGDAGLDMKGGNNKGKRNSSGASTSAAGRPGRPSATRNNTWTGSIGWLNRPQSITMPPRETAGYQDTTTPNSRYQGSDAGSAMHSRSQSNISATQHNAGDGRLPTIIDHSEGMSTPNAMAMSNAKGFFDNVGSPLDQPQTVFNRMHSQG